MLSNKPLVTIVTVTYNSSKYVRDAIEGVLAQSYTNIEYIIADDGSTDDTWKIINEYKDLRIIAYKNETNLREYPNRNKAIEKATGEYLIFIDGDDIIYPNAIEIFVKMITAFPKAAMIIQRSYYNNILFPLLLNSKEIIDNKFFGSFDLTSSSLASNFFKTETLKSVGSFRTDLKAADEEIRVKIGCNNNILFICGWLVWPRETPGQAASKITQVDSIMETIDFVNKLYQAKVLNVSEERFNNIIFNLQRAAAITVVQLLLKMQIKNYFIEKTKTNLGWIKVFSLANKNRIYDDMLDNHKPINPITRNFFESPYSNKNAID